MQHKIFATKLNKQPYRQPAVRYSRLYRFVCTNALHERAMSDEEDDATAMFEQSYRQPPVRYSSLKRRIIS